MVSRSWMVTNVGDPCKSWVQDNVVASRIANIAVRGGGGFSCKFCRWLHISHHQYLLTYYLKFLPILVLISICKSVNPCQPKLVWLVCKKHLNLSSGIFKLATFLRGKNFYFLPKCCWGGFDWQMGTNLCSADVNRARASAYDIKHAESFKRHAFKQKGT